MGLQKKATILTVVLTGTLLVLVVAVMLYFFRHFSLETVRDQVRSVAEIVRVSLTESMINGVIDRRQQFLQRLAEVDGFEQARVVRGPEVNRQFGQNQASELSADEIEQQVLDSGVSSFQMLSDSETPIFRGTIAFVAHERGTPNCLQCHQVANGTVLGVITVHISMEKMQRRAFLTSGIVVFLILIFGIIFTLLFRWQLSLVVHTAQEVELVVAKAKDGDFSGRLGSQGQDEMGRIARDLNSLMSHLQEGLGTISCDIARLMRYELQGNTNMLTTTTEMVTILLDVAQFKQAVEEDRSVQDVYQRISRVLSEQFWIKDHAIYEVVSGGNNLRPVLVNGRLDVEEDSCCWCHAQVLVSSVCRAQNTADVVDSFQDRFTCPQFVRSEATANLDHICLPVIHSGAVGNVIQIVIEKRNSQLYRLLLPFIHVYLRESSSTVEAKRLLDISRESALRDPLTGLHNRRFLEEYVATLESTTRRHKTRLAVLVLDLDHFKMVNDTWGHDAGDSVLKALAKVLSLQVVRTSDLVIRFGGEEFVVILHQNDQSFGASMAERIRVAVENLQIPINETLLKRTISIGVANFPNDGMDLWSVLKKADLALYQAKARGRNQVVVYQAEPETGTETET